MKRWLVGWLLGLCVVGFVMAAGLRYDMTEAEVRAAAGPPTSLLDRGDRAIWMYPDGGRVEFEQGRAISIQNMLMATEAELIEAQAAAAEAEHLAVEEAELLAAEEVTAMEAEMAVADAAVMQAMSDSVEQLEAQYEGGGMPVDLGLGPPEPKEYWLTLAVQAVLGVLITMVVLKMAFKWADIHADWSQMFLPALVDMFAVVVIRAGGYVLLKTDQFFHIDDGVSFFALLITLKLTTHASSLQRAVTVAVAAKLASIVVWSLLSVVILQAMFG